MGHQISTGWSSSLQSFPDEPMSPSGLGQGGKRARDDQAALAPGQAEAVQASRYLAAFNKSQDRRCGVCYFDRLV